MLMPVTSLDASWYVKHWGAWRPVVKSAVVPVKGVVMQDGTTMPMFYSIALLVIKLGDAEVCFAYKLSDQINATQNPHKE